MQAERQRTLEDVYSDFLEFVRVDVQHERLLVHRKMFGVFLWCFAFPAAFSATLLLLIKLQVLPLKARAYLDWVILIFPVVYSLYVLGSQVLIRVPGAFRRGGMAGTLGQASTEAKWRERVRKEMQKTLGVQGEEWRWLVENFRIDLGALQSRTRFLTGLAGSVFFLIMQGIDSLGEGGAEASVTWSRNPITGWVETSTYDFSQFVGLILFLVLLYLSGNQTYHALTRYLHCAELNLLEGPDRRKH